MSTFELDLRRFKKKIEGRAKLVVQKVALDIDKGVVLQTPVDTGRARGGWNVGINNVNLSDTGEDKSGAKTIAENESTITRADHSDAIFISNNVDYIEELEKGSSDQAPQGMVAKTLRRFPQIVRKATNEAKREQP